VTAAPPVPARGTVVPTTDPTTAPVPDPVVPADPWWEAAPGGGPGDAGRSDVGHDADPVDGDGTGDGTGDGAAADAGPGGPPDGDGGSPGGRRWPARLVLGRPEDPWWVRPSLLVLLASTAVLYLWALGDSGWANSFYSAAVQAGTKSLKAAFFGSSDASNFITVDKPPASLWVMELSARIFGVNSWAILVPQALEGVATVGLLYLVVRRWFPPAAALLAGLVLALTPVAALMFRFNNPDALLALLMTAAMYTTIRALEYGSTRWLLLTGALIGTGFITKMLQAFIVIPVIGLVYLLAGPPKLGRRLVQLLALGASVVVFSGWWVAVVELTPAADRPYVGGSQNNSLFNLIIGYNGVGRLTGNEAGSVGGAGPPGSMWGPTGWNRLFLSDMGGQISWLLPAALVLLVAALVLTLRSPRTDRTRSAFLLWGGSLVLTAVVFSFAQGIIHPYYTVALAPAIGAVVGMGAAVFWARRSKFLARMVLALALLAAVGWSYELLGRTPDWNPWLRGVVVVVGAVTAVALVALGWIPRLRGWPAAAVATLGITAALAGPAAYSLQTASTPHSGAIPSAGPAVPTTFGPGGRGFPGFRGFAGGAAGRIPAGFRPGGAFGGPGGATGATGGGFGSGFAGPPGGFGGFGGTGGGFAGGRGFGGGRGGVGGGRGGFGGGGFLNASTPGPQLVTAIRQDASKYTWPLATVDSNNASGYQLASGEPVMAIGGFNGTDPAPTLAEFQRYVAEGKIHYFVSGGGGGASGKDASAIDDWVLTHFAYTTVDGVNLYDLTRPT